MSVIAAKAPYSISRIAIVDWFLQMKAALTQPAAPKPIRYTDIAMMVDRGISRIRTQGIDPRI